MRRLFLPLLLLSGLLWSMSSPALASNGAPFKGELIDSSKTISNVTGGCTCLANWYTFAMNPGSFSVTAVLKGYGMKLTSIYGLRVSLYSGSPSHQISYAQTACFASARACNRAARIRRHVRRSTVFYLEIYGPGANGVRYTLAVHGNTRVLRCRARCY